MICLSQFQTSENSYSLEHVLRFPNVKIIAISGDTHSSGADALNAASLLGHGIHHAGELGEQPIPRRLNHPP